MFDLDGVVYIGNQVLPWVSSSVERLRREGVHVAFVTNNASRTPAVVATRLGGMGVDARPDDVVTSAQAAATLVVERMGLPVRAMALGGQSLADALTQAGATVVSRAVDAEVVVSGYGPDVLWRDIMAAARVVRSGVPYIASNADLTIPTPEGLAPGHGVLVRTISDFAGVKPLIAGKPEPPLLEETVRRVGGTRPLMVGDRLDTDIEGANRVGVPSLLVMTGVTGLADLVAAPAELRPTYIAPDTRGLFVTHPRPTTHGGTCELGGWSARVTDGKLAVSGHGGAMDWWRVVADAAWGHLDREGAPVDTSHLDAPEASGPDVGR